MINDRICSDEKYVYNLIVRNIYRYTVLILKHCLIHLSVTSYKSLLQSNIQSKLTCRYLYLRFTFLTNLKCRLNLKKKALKEHIFILVSLNF